MEVSNGFEKGKIIERRNKIRLLTKTIGSCFTAPLNNLIDIFPGVEVKELHACCTWLPTFYI